MSGASDGGRLVFPPLFHTAATVALLDATLAQKLEERYAATWQQYQEDYQAVLARAVANRGDLSEVRALSARSKWNLYFAFLTAQGHEEHPSGGVVPPGPGDTPAAWFRYGAVRELKQVLEHWPTVAEAVAHLGIPDVREEVVALLERDLAELRIGSRSRRLLDPRSDGVARNRRPRRGRRP